MKLSRVLSISRPRFWLYEFGTYMIGILAGLYRINNLPNTTIDINLLSSAPKWIVYIGHHRQTVVLRGVYFLISANIYIYGINDIYDYETDKNNPKKQGYEDLVNPSEAKGLRFWILATNLPFLLLLIGQEISIICIFVAFVFFAGQYSAYPIRAKIRSIVDCLFSAGHYVATAVFGTVLVAGMGAINWYYVLGGVLWCMAMHIYSAIPDIKADAEAGMNTTAMLFGAKGSIYLVGILYILSGLLSYSWLGIWGPIISLIYISMMIWSYIYIDDNPKLLEIYKYFPWINAGVGMIIFWSVLLRIL